MTYIPTPNCQIKNLTQIYLDYFGYIDNGLFVEIGAFNCFNWSNTYTLAQAGWNGLLVEPVPEYFADCVKLYKDNPKIRLVQCAISDHNQDVKLFLGGSNSTIRPEMVEIYNSIEWAKFSGLRDDNYITVSAYALDYLLAKHLIPTGFEVLVIDVEGAELDVLSGFTLDYWQPQMVIIEAHEQCEDLELAKKADAINLYFRDYHKIYSDHINNIYINGNLKR